MSSFFTLPPSQRKRKREEATNQPLVKRRNIANKAKPKASKANPQRDESISGSGSEDERKQPSDQGDESSSEFEEGDETAADRRLRLAEQYLESVKEEVDEIEYDAEETDRDLIAERLQKDVAETKGRLYRHIVSDLDLAAASMTNFRAETASVTSLAICPPYAYTVSKDVRLTKWQISTPSSQSFKKSSKLSQNSSPPIRRRPLKLLSTKGRKSKDLSPTHHTAPILTVAASSTGKFVATGGADKRLIVWDASNLKPLKVFTQHRDAVTGLTFCHGTNQLYSASKDRTIKVWSLDELAYIETLFGHQDEVVDVAALAQERCVSVGARDRTARLWKVAEETQLVFRGGGSGSKSAFQKNPHAPVTPLNDLNPPTLKSYNEGSIDRIALIDNEMFITASDNGSLSLWNIHKKKPVFVLPLAHGLDPSPSANESYAEADPNPEKVAVEPQPRWITALATVPYSDLVLTGSWDGTIRVWKIAAARESAEKKGAMRIEGAGLLGRNEDSKDGRMLKGIVNDIRIFERREQGREGICIAVALGVEHRLGRWKRVKGNNGAVVLEVPKMQQNEKGKSNGVESNENKTETKSQGDIISASA